MFKSATFLKYSLVFSLFCGLFLSAHQIYAAEQAEKPHVVFVVGTTHYSPQKTIPVFAKRLEQYGFKTR